MRQTKRDLEKRLKEQQLKYEREVWDLKQLIEISKSLNSTLDYNNLIQSILYICMGQMRVFKAGLFVRKDIDRQTLILHRSQLGFDLDHGIDYHIPEHHPLLNYLQDNCTVHTWEELLKAPAGVESLPSLTSLEPVLIVPLMAKTTINGVLVLADPMAPVDFEPTQKSYVMDIATLAGIAVHNAFLYEVTTTDMMTKLKLKHYFMDALVEAMAAARRNRTKLSLVMIDIDKFKNLNDNMGHLCGDKVIQEVSDKLLLNTRQSDLAARYGGEEFVLLLPNTDLNTAVNIAERIRISIEETSVPWENQDVQVTVSLGVAEYRSESDVGIKQLIDRADKALYLSKNSGRNKVSVLT